MQNCYPDNHSLVDYHYMTFELWNATSTFQRMMDDISRDMECTFVYINDILIYSDDKDSHPEHLDQIFRKVSEYNFKISISKCIFNAIEFDLLGFNISKEGIKPKANKLQELNNFPPPNDSKT